MRFDTIVTDLDGTLLDENSQISPRTLSVLRNCTRRGIRVILNSGRTKASIRPFMDQLQTGQPYAGGNGTEIISTQGEYLYHAVLDVQTIRDVCRILESFHLYAQVYDEDCFYFEAECKESVDYHQASSMKAIPIGKLSENIWKPSSKVLAINSPEKNQIARKALQDHFGDSLYFTTSCFNYLEIMPAGNTKGEALRRMMEWFHWDADKILTFGDGQNDTSMLQAVPHGVAMDNADEMVKASAWRVCAANTEDGLARFIEENVLSERGLSM